MKQWENIGEGVDRMPVEGGYLYITRTGLVFVPCVEAELTLKENDQGVFMLVRT
jgi:hypothetical protein